MKDRGHGVKEPTALRQVSPTYLLIVLSTATLPTALPGLMQRPHLVAIANEFQASGRVV